MTLRLLDTFSGIGGFSLAARWLGGYETVQFVEKEPWCHKILSKHWPDVPIHDDITTYKGEPGSADVICGGFPCQDISQAGKKAGIKEGTRSGLFYQLMRVVCEVRPGFVVLENVAAILDNATLGTVLSELAEAGYDAEWACIPASAVGACHQRDRWWCVAANTDHQGSQGRLTASLPERGQQWLARPRDSCGQRLIADWRSHVSEPVLRRGDDGLSGRVDRLKGLGNAVVPQVAMIPLARVLELAGCATAE